MEFVAAADQTSIPWPVERVQRSLLGPFCEQAGVDMPEEPQKTAELFEACRTGIGTLFETEEGKLALSGVLVQKWERDETGTPQLTYIRKTGKKLAARIEALSEDDWSEQITAVAKDQEKTRDVAFTSLRSIWRRYGALTAQREQAEDPDVSLVAFATRNTIDQVAKPLPGKPLRAQSKTEPQTITKEIQLPTVEMPKQMTTNPEVAALLETLEPAEQIILGLFFGLRGAPLSYAQISKCYSWDMDETKRIAAGAMAKLRGIDRITLRSALAAAIEQRYGRRS
jgi:hypothetical protein